MELRTPAASRKIKPRALLRLLQTHGKPKARLPRQWPAGTNLVHERDRS
jgi:hypothetical protein